ncbi:MAG: FadR family transcriptional regulator [Chloroflexi bacterium]|nr:FadR family transcriptional regulator [Chloroflexota bacterium]
MADTPMVTGVPVNARRLHEAVVDQLLRQIVGGALPAGATLPNEVVLAAHFGVSRTVLREATRLLAAKGLVRVKHGSGVWVQPADEWDRLDPRILFAQVQVSRDARVLDDVLEARRLLEVELAGLAAARRTAGDLAGLSAAIALLRATLSETGAFGQSDIAFHDCVFRAAHNPLLRKTVLPVVDTLFQLRGQITDRRDSHVEQSQAGHEAVWQAIVDGDVTVARAAMRDHVAQFEMEVRASDLF